ASLSNTTITLSGFSFYTSLDFSDLSNVHTKIQEIINSNSYSSSDFLSYVNNNSSSLKTLFVDNVTTTFNGPGRTFSASQITNVVYSGGNIIFNFNVPTNYKYSITSYSYASFSNNSLTFSSFSYYTPSSTNCFTTSGTTITGLTSEGNKQSRLVIPRGYTAIGNSAFADKSTNIKEIILPEGITSIGEYAFSQAKGLTTITFPSTVTWIGYRALWGCSNITTVNCLSTGEISMRDGIMDYATSISAWNFKGLTVGSNLKTTTYSFSGSSKLKIYVVSQNVKNYIVNLKRTNANSSNIFVTTFS
ncbi:MAG: leucine-rich repeat domain-containing protein, partial [Ureaplasma sp.]|nr:leucine-rich repeat domain-containing protein [Ureaplasma sp.]